MGHNTKVHSVHFRDLFSAYFLLSSPFHKIQSFLGQLIARSSQRWLQVCAKQKSSEDGVQNNLLRQRITVTKLVTGLFLSSAWKQQGRHLSFLFKKPCTAALLPQKSSRANSWKMSLHWTSLTSGKWFVKKEIVFKTGFPARYERGPQQYLHVARTSG